MRDIGSKENLLGFIESAASSKGITGGTFCDLYKKRQKSPHLRRGLLLW